MSDDPVHRSSGEGGAPGLTELFDALAADRRRWFLYHLSDSTTTGFDDAVEAIREWERGHGAYGSGDHAFEISASLHHIHLPFLEDIGLVTYDEERRRITYHRHPHVDELLEWAEELDRHAVEREC